MANTQRYIDDYIRQYLLAQEEARRNNSPLKSGINKVNDINKFSSNLDTTGKFLTNNFDNSFLNGVGSKMSDASSFINSKMQPVNNVLSNIGLTSPAATTGATAAGTTGATTAGTAAGTTAGTASGVGAGTAAGTASAGAAAGSTAGAAAGSTAGGAAAGSAAGASGAGGAAAAGPIGALVALGVMAALGTHRKAAKKSANAMLKASEQENEALMQESEQQQAQNQQQLNNIVNNSNIQPTFTGNNTQMPEDVVNNLQGDYGFMTGGAAPVQNNTSLGYDGSATQYLQENMPRFAGVRENNEVKQGILNKLASGIGDFAQGYQENRNTGFAPENLMPRQDINTFKQNINPADYTTKLNSEEQKQFNIWADDMKSRGMINPNDNFQDYDMQGYWKNEVLNNTDLANGNAQNHFTDKYKMPNHETFSNESQYATGDNARYAGSWNGDKFNSPLKNNKMTRAGEFLGSAARIAQNPGVQALLAGGISTALTGNPLYGAGMAYKFGNQRAMSELYRDVLAQNGIQTQEPGIFGNVSSNDMKNIGNMMETKHRNDVWDRYYADKIINDVNELDYKMQKDEEDRKYKAKDYELKVNKYNEDVRHNKAMENKPSEPKPEDHKNWSKDLSDYLKIKSQYPHNAEAARIDFINEHNVDPEKYLVQKQSNNTNNRFERR